MYWWRVLNRAVFDNELRMPYNVRIRKYNKYNDPLGMCSGKDYSKLHPVTFDIKEEMDDRKMFMDVLAHEMVHQWEQQTFGNMTHGKNFYKWKRKLKELGITLNESY